MKHLLVALLCMVALLLPLTASRVSACELNREEFRWSREDLGPRLSAHITVEGTMKTWKKTRVGSREYGFLYIKGYLDGKWIGNAQTMVNPDGSFDTHFIDKGHLVKPNSTLKLKITCG